MYWFLLSLLTRIQKSWIWANRVPHSSSNSMITDHDRVGLCHDIAARLPPLQNLRHHRTPPRLPGIVSALNLVTEPASRAGKLIGSWRMACRATQHVPRNRSGFFLKWNSPKTTAFNTGHPCPDVQSGANNCIGEAIHEI